VLVPSKSLFADFGRCALPALPSAADLASTGSRAAIGERIVIGGRVCDSAGQPLRGALLEIWQANAAGRYRHRADTHEAPLDPNFDGRAWLRTDEEGRYTLATIRPGAYPWRNHPNAWRPAHVHFSVLTEDPSMRLLTQMYFPGDPLLPLDPIFMSIPAAEARARLVAVLDFELSSAELALGYRFDLTLGGVGATPSDPT
jgi:protocatechuate 3,4-dioxygenase beta subunit